MNLKANPPRHREIAAGCVLSVIVVHLLLAQLTLVLAVVFVVVSRLTRWRLSWLLVPAAAGLAWIGAGGPGPALAGFTAGPAAVLRYLGGGDLAARAGHPLAGLSSGLPGQFPVALLVGAAEAALAGWLAWRRTGDRAVPVPRPGAVAAVRRALTVGWISAGAVLTRDGCALGVVPSTGAVAELRWTELAGGLLVTGAAPRAATVTSLQVVHAALRRRKPLIVLAPGDDASLTGALRAACAATGVPLQAGGEPASPDAEASASRLWGRGKTGDQPAGTAPAPADLGRVVRERSAVLVAAGSPELAARACRDIAAVAADLRRIGVDGDGLVWVPDGDRVPRDALAALLADGSAAGLPVLVTTTSPDVAADLAGRVGALLALRVTDQALAGALAARAGPRLRPAPLLELGPAEFVLAVGPPRPRLTVPGRLVLARLPSGSAPPDSAPSDSARPARPGPVIRR